MSFGIQTRNETKQATISVQKLSNPPLNENKRAVSCCRIPLDLSWDPSRGLETIALVPVEHFGLFYRSQ